jgi:sugar lactone lactonase YvrE
VERYGVAHPVLDDPELITWDRAYRQAWPTLSVVDPEGYVVASMAGEGHAEGLVRLIDELIETHRTGTLHRGDGPYVPPAERATELRFPGKAITGPTGRLLVSDSAHHSIVELDGETVLRRIGSGERGRTDGLAPSFSEPAGLCLLPTEVAAAVGYDLVVADTVNHLLRGVRLDTGEVTTVAGTGNPWRSAQAPGDPEKSQADGALSVDLSSPWDLAWYDGKVIVAMAGIHQLWWFDPANATAGVYAGTTVEALRDGDLHQVWMAQPSGLSVSADGNTLWVADSESSALRFVRDGQMHTVVGQGLFDFGHMDGPAPQALLQHPLGVCALPDGSVLVPTLQRRGAALRPHYRLGLHSCHGPGRPSDIVLLGDAVLVVESAAHRVTQLAPGALAAVALGPGTARSAPSLLAPGQSASTSSSLRRPGRSWTTRSVRRRGCRSPRRRPNCWFPVRAPQRTCRAISSSRRAWSVVCCRSWHRPPVATPTSSTPPATSPVRTGVSRSW